MSTHPQPPAGSARKAVTLPRLREMRAAGEKIAMLTCYDASFARLLDAAGVDCCWSAIRSAWWCRATTRRCRSR